MSIHKTVLLNETIEGLNLKDGSVILDATFGGGGHSAEICQRYKKIKIIAVDQDEDAWERAKEKFQNCDCKISFVNKNFKDLEDCVVDAIIFDLGLSSDQLDNSGRGFSFKIDEPLLMTMKAHPTKEDLTARDIVNTWSEKSLADIFYGYGEEKYAKRIAKTIVEERERKEINTTFELLKIIEKSVPGGYRKMRLHFATRTFQALRIAVNDELETLKIGLAKGFKFLKSEGRMAVISFHSLEDRIVKNFYKEKKQISEARLINKKPIIAGDIELKINSRARSAKLRILEKI